jgi:ABC exporter DevB family membrane fusion protein
MDRIKGMIERGRGGRSRLAAVEPAGFDEQVEATGGADMAAGLPLDQNQPTRRMVRWGVLSAALLLALLAAYAAVTAVRGSGDGATFEVRCGRIHRVIAGKGKIEPFAELRLTASLPGRIKSILVEEGDHVRRGQVLVLMQDEELRAQFAQAQARLEEANAKYAEVEAGPRPQELEAARARVREVAAVLQETGAVLNRTRALFEKGTIPRAQLDEAERRHAVAIAQHRTAVEQISLLESGARQEVRRAAQAQVKTAEADVQHVRALLDQATIRAPVAGKIVHRFMQPGEVIVMQRPQPILTLADLSRIQVRVEIDETDARYLEVGQPVEVTSNAYSGRVFTGRVAEIGATAGRKSLVSEDPAAMLDTKVVEIIVTLPESNAWTLGVTVDAAVTVEHRENVPIVPRSAVRQAGRETAVMVRRGGSYERQPIRTGASDEDYVEVVSGLEDGDVVLRR